MSNSPRELALRTDPPTSPTVKGYFSTKASQNLPLVILRDIISDCAFPRNGATKMVWRHYDFRKSGSKRSLVARILLFRQKTRCAIIIQRRLRGLFARIFLLARGLLFRNKCVNSADFCTLDSICDIPIGLFFGYTDTTGFTYGFNLISLLSLSLSSAKDSDVLNPYTRMPIPRRVIWTANLVYRISRALFPVYLPELSLGDPVPVKLCSRVNTRQLVERAHMRMVRHKPLAQREAALFMEINMLGNDSHISWFSDMDEAGYLGIYVILRDMWIVDLGLSNATRKKICPMGDPFVWTGPPYMSDRLPSMREYCIFVAENMTMTSRDIEFRRLGALYFLIAVACISIPARESMPWLQV